LARYKYIQTISKSASMFSEWEYINGNVILRLSNVLTKSQAEQYNNALNAMQAG
jgi:hypothetical protein